MVFQILTADWERFWVTQIPLLFFDMHQRWLLQSHSTNPVSSSAWGTTLAWTKASPAFLEGGRPPGGLLEESTLAGESSCSLAGCWLTWIANFILRQSWEKDRLLWMAGTALEVSVGDLMFICLSAQSLNPRMNITKQFSIAPSHREKSRIQKTKAESKHPSVFGKLRTHLMVLCGTGTFLVQVFILALFSHMQIIMSVALPEKNLYLKIQEDIELESQIWNLLSSWPNARNIAPNYFVVFSPVFLKKQLPKIPVWYTNMCFSDFAYRSSWCYDSGVFLFFCFPCELSVVELYKTFLA